MNATQRLHDLGQSLWLDNIPRVLLSSGTLGRYISDYAVTGLTSNPTIFEQAIGKSDSYDAAIRDKAQAGKSGEALFFELALEDLTRAADLFAPADRANLFIKIPGTRAGITAIEEAIFAGVPVNVTLLFSREHYLAAAEAYLRGIERRIAIGRDPNVASVASLFVSRWDAAVKDQVPDTLPNRRGIAIAQRTYKAYRELLSAPRWQKLANAGARPQRLLWASTGTKDPAAPDTLYLTALAAPDTVNTIPEPTLLAFAEHGNVGEVLSPDGGDAEAVLAEFARAGIAITALATKLQQDGGRSFAKSWRSLLDCIESKGAALVQSRAGGGRP